MMEAIKNIFLSLDAKAGGANEIPGKSLLPKSTPMAWA